MTTPDAQDSTRVAEAVSRFGVAVRAKLTAGYTRGGPEEQLRGPFEGMMKALAAVGGLDPDQLVLVGESNLVGLATRPDFAVTYANELVGYVELKAPGKGADPRRFMSDHDKNQGKKLRSLPNVMFSDGAAFSLWQDGEIVGKVEQLDGDLETAGAALAPSSGLLRQFIHFLRWQPIPPRTPKQLASASARLCRLLRDEVTEQLDRSAPALVSLASDWRHLLFPAATNEQFADGYAQAVTFGLLLGRARGIDFGQGIGHVARELGDTNSLIGRSLSILTDTAVSHGTLATSVRTLMRVLSVVDWPKLSKGDPEAWLYFYEYFLAEYDSSLRKKTGSYYTPPPIVEAMTRWTDEALTDRLNLPSGLADDSVVIVDPAMGTGTYLLEVLRRIGARVANDQGEGARGPLLDLALRRLVGFEIQLGPYAVAQLRLLAELADLGAASTPKNLRTYVTDTLSNPYIEGDLLAGSWYEPIAASRRAANKVKREEAVLVVLGNPPYKEKAKGRGGWIEAGTPDTGPARLRTYFPPREWGIGAHTKHLYNLYVYFWRWAQWKVFEQHAESPNGVICFITVAGFLDGDGFQQMRASLRSEADRIWIIDCSPEGHQPKVTTRVFQGVQHPVCIVLAVKDSSTDRQTAAKALWRTLPLGHRDAKFQALPTISLSDTDWEPVPSDWRAPFTPEPDAMWSKYPALEDFFGYNASGMMPGRTWVYAPDAQTLKDRWARLVSVPSDAEKRALFVEHATDRTLDKKLGEGLPGFPAPVTSIGKETGSAPAPVRVAFRSFDRQWVLPDKRLINRPNPTLWASRSAQQVFLTALSRTSPRGGPAVTFTAVIPDIDHYDGRGGRVFPLWRDGDATESNVPVGVLSLLTRTYGRPVSSEEVVCYLAAILAHPGYVARYEEDLQQPGLRLPLTASAELFDRAVELGRRVVWLHTFGERFHDGSADRPDRPPRTEPSQQPRVLGGYPIPSGRDDMPDELGHDAAREELHVGAGRISNVTRDMREYRVSGTNVLDRWFNARRETREKPVIGDRHLSALLNIRAEAWLPEYTTELIDLLNVLRLLVDLEPEQDKLLDQVATGVLLDAAAVAEALGRWAQPVKARTVAQEDEKLW